MNEIEIKMFPASYGDSFLVTCKGKKNTHILIDMGFMSTYNNSIKQELKAIKEINKEEIDLLIFTHVDEDHILGGMKFFQENGNFNDPQIVAIKEIWYNSYKHLQFKKRQEDKSLSNEEQKLTSLLKTIVERGHAREKGVRTVSGISIGQAFTLSALLHENGYDDIWNKSYNNNVVKLETEFDDKTLKSHYINEEVKIIILSPSQEKLEILDEKWEEYLIKMGCSNINNGNELMDSAFEVYMANLQVKKKKRSVNPISIGAQENIKDIAEQPFDSDTAEINGSSIAFILEFYGKRLLFLGDSHSSVIEQSLKKVLETSGEKKLRFDAVKISHHGSKHNTSPDLLKMIESEKYIISTNGRGKNFSHPDVETIYRIIAFNTLEKTKIIFNYKPFNIYNKINVQGLKEKYNYEIEYTNDSLLSKKEETTKIIIK
ncbi:MULTISPECIES: MBL fold metallo-hydrolase [Bacillus cereus group]|uniref:Zn-dependent hydrolase n=1 Tax=Bacillus thuringiensis serovar mexicanensis TaxID=180868 RepID=A0A242W6F3_BACTU|nr:MULTISPECIES: MBL fold metallo-hydrolase [Bacillus cereus group]EEM56187.1 Zn-dependent hydrolase [Bacillus thuringiensis serovar monterrey BGSC 4AJ1]MEB9674117.1 Zn-dependent hydrolase [Bacillus anthracis]OTW47532.1 Zn-dependent hydrolase [Bacillus thuringiensis serovar mexicanensis]OTX11797.1 Zn-dependent hydrolase [Bacillus thuringiensis serovar monterrey]